MTSDSSSDRSLNGRNRLAGVAVIAIAGGAALIATGFRVSFPTDSLGPRAFPLISTLLIAVGAVALFRPDDAVVQWPDGAAARRIVAASSSFVAYAFVLEPLGFVLATALEFFALALLFGGRPSRSMLAGAVAGLLLYALFVYGLGLPLPLGPFVR